MIYTKKGDDGTTSLVGGSRVQKSDPRVEAYGTVDELNAHLGLLAAMLTDHCADTRLDTAAREALQPVACQLKSIQNRLFVIQTLLATEDAATYARLPQLPADATAEMERWIDSLDSRLPKLNSFVIPGGSLQAAQAHVARTVCRRAEREVVRLAACADIDKSLRSYLNRLSDYLFVVSRFVLVAEQKEENFWSAV